MLCEMCGKDVPFIKTIKVEGTFLKACSDCSKFGAELTKKEERTVSVPGVTEGLERRLMRRREKDVFESGGELELVLDYPQRIRKARNAKSWKQEELAAKINEKKSVIMKLETGDIRPDEKLIAKLEKALNITLKEKYERVVTRSGSESSGGVTLGDLITMQEE